MTQSVASTPIRLSVVVRVPVKRAFEAFTNEMDDWWPLASHSISEDPRAQVILEGRVGGRVIERSPEGVEESWGELIVWEPPHRLVLAWRPNPMPGPRTEVEITFRPDGDGTRVDLEHRGWERFGDEAEEYRAGYASQEGGWPMVIGRFDDFLR